MRTIQAERVEEKGAPKPIEELIGQSAEDSGIQVGSSEGDEISKIPSESENAKDQEKLDSGSKSPLETTEPSIDDVKSPDEKVENNALIMKSNSSETENPEVSELDKVNSPSKSNGELIDPVSDEKEPSHTPKSITSSGKSEIQMDSQKSSDRPSPTPNEGGNMDTNTFAINPASESMNQETPSRDLKNENEEEKLVNGKLTNESQEESTIDVNDTSEIPLNDQVEPEHAEEEQSIPSDDINKPTMNEAIDNIMDYMMGSDSDENPEVNKELNYLQVQKFHYFYISEQKTK